MQIEHGNHPSIYSSIGSIENMEEEQQQQQQQQEPQQTIIRGRMRFTPQHNQYLETMYQLSRYPDKAQKTMMAAALGIKEDQVNNWFTRRRRKDNDPTTTQVIDSGQVSVAPRVTPRIVPKPATTYSSNVEEYSYLVPMQNLHDFQNMHNIEMHQTPYQYPIDHPQISVVDEEMQDLANQPQESTPEDFLLPYLNSSSMGLRSSKQVKEFVKVMKDEKVISRRALILAAIGRTQDVVILKSFIESKGGHVLRVWLMEALKENNSPLLVKILEVLDRLPLDKEGLIASQLGKAVNKGAKNSSEQSDVRKMAVKLIDKWKKLLETSEESESKRIKTSDNSFAKISTSTATATSSKFSASTLSDAQKKFASTAETSKLISAESSRRTISAVSSSAAGKPQTKLKSAALTAPKSTVREIGKVTAASTTNVSVESTSSSQKSKSLPVKEPTNPEIKQDKDNNAIAKESESTASTMSARVESTKTAFEIALESRNQGINVQAKTSIVEDTQMQVDRNKKRKRVSFAPENLLRQIKIFESEDTEDEDELSMGSNIPHQFGNARDLEVNEGQAVFKRSFITPTMEWYTPIEINLESINIPVIVSAQARMEKDRQKSILETIYLKREHVPDSPEEPNDIIMIDFNQKCLEIPLDEQIQISQIQTDGSLMQNGVATSAVTTNMNLTNTTPQIANQTPEIIEILKKNIHLQTFSNNGSNLANNIPPHNHIQVPPHPQQTAPLFPVGNNVNLFGGMDMHSSSMMAGSSGGTAMGMPPPQQIQGQPQQYGEGRALPPQSEIRPQSDNRQQWSSRDDRTTSRGRGRGTPCWFGRDCNRPNCKYVHD
ncbi:11455_t:CDS:10 [Ambispora leptoticha]|uniref:11455_t:CDS:1 n=1 Tax=Ambispora leptoticha TaxID=144679 RepID=A0A9N8VA85_9GLOM|nr:11455_t:CDS:10 [Ambispora leptoticha]